MDVTGKETQLLGRLLGAAELRAQVIAANIANQNTPGYTRRDVHFEDLLRQSLKRGGVGFEDIKPEIVTDDATPRRPDGNNVHLEAEMNAMRENRLLYETYSAIMQGHFEMLRSAITGTA